jgi:FG-GAP-like repeat/FG-GAP repeat
MMDRYRTRFVLSMASAAALLCACGCGGAGMPGGSSGKTGLSFLNSSNPATNPWPQSVAVGDFNGDGKLDLAVPVYSIFTPLSDMNILLGNGDGTFSAGPAFPLAGQNVNNAAVADFNGDGKPDLAISLPDANEIQVLLGNGDGSFTPLPAITANAVFVVVTADLNRDGKADLVAVNPGLGTVTILLGNGDGSFTSAPSITTPTSGPGGVAVVPVALTVDDFNKDGILDMAVVNGPQFDQGVPGSLTILLGNGDGTFTATSGSIATGNSPIFVAAGDLNGDGNPDLVVTNMNHGFPDLGTLIVLLGNGDGTFTPTPTTLTVGSIPSTVSVADFNGDGKPDLVTANAGSNTVSVLLGNGDGTFAAPMNVAAGTDPIFAATADFNHDGIPDLAMANNSTSSVTVLLTKH